MKKIIVILLYIIVAVSIYAQKEGNSLRVFSKKATYNHSVLLSEIDSITYDNAKLLQIVHGKNNLEFPITQIDSVVYQEKVKFSEIDVNESFKAIIAEDGKALLYGKDSIGNYVLQYGEYDYYNNKWIEESVFLVQYDTEDNPIAIKTANGLFLSERNEDGTINVLSVNEDGSYKIIASHIDLSDSHLSRGANIRKAPSNYSVVATYIGTAVTLASYITSGEAGITGVISGLGAIGSLVGGNAGFAVSGASDAFFLAGGSIASLFTLGLATTVQLHEWARRLQEERVGDWNIEIVSVHQITRKECEITYYISGINSSPKGSPVFSLSFIDANTHQYINKGLYVAHNGIYTHKFNIEKGGKYSAKMMLYDQSLPCIFKFSNLKDFYMADISLNNIKIGNDYSYKNGSVDYNLTVSLSGNKENLTDAAEYGYYISFSNTIPIYTKVNLTSSNVESTKVIQVNREDFFEKNYNTFHAEASEYKIGAYAKLKNGDIITFGERKIEGLVYDKKPNIKYTSASLSSVTETNRKTDDNGVTTIYYKAVAKLGWEDQGSFWIDYAFRKTSDGGQGNSFSPSDGTGTVTYTWSYSSNSFHSKESWYEIHLINGGTKTSSNKVLFSGSPSNPRVSVIGY